MHPAPAAPTQRGLDVPRGAHRARSASEPLAYADLVLRRLAAECCQAPIEMVRVVDLTARIELGAPWRAGVGSAFESAGPCTLELPRTRRVLDALVESATGCLPDVVPFVTAATGGTATVAGAPAGGRRLGAAVARRAVDLHWLAPWRDEVVTVAAQPGPACQADAGLLLGGPAGVPGARPVGADRARAFLVLAGEEQRVDLERLRTTGAVIGVLRFPEGAFDDGSAESAVASPLARPAPVSVGREQYVLVEELILEGE